MKYSLVQPVFLVLLFYLLSCSGTNDEGLDIRNLRVAQKTNTIKTIKLDDFTALDIIRFVRVQQIEGTNIIAFLNTPLRTIYVYDWDKGDLLNKIRIPKVAEKWGFPNDVINYELISTDSAWVAGNSAPFLALYDSTSKMLDKVVLPYEDPTLEYTWGQMKYINNYLYFHCHSLSDKNPPEKAFAFRYDMIKRHLDTIAYSYPSEYHNRLSGISNDFYKDFKFEYDSINQVFLYSFLGVPDVLRVGLTDRKQDRLVSKVQGLVARPMTTKERDQFHSSFDLTPIVTRHKFFSTRFSSNNHSYYKLIRFAVDEDKIPSDDPKAHGVRSPHGMLILNKGESQLYLLPDNSKNAVWYEWVLIDDAIYVPEKTENEDELVLRKYEFN